MADASKAFETSPVTILYHPTFAPRDRLVYDVADPHAEAMQTSVTYVGAHPGDRETLMADARGKARGLANPPKGAWLAGLAVHAVLPDFQSTVEAERPAPELIPARNTLAGQFAAWALGQRIRNFQLPRIHGATAPPTLAEVFAQLGERSSPTPWNAYEQENLAAVLHEPGFNTLVMLGMMHQRQLAPQDFADETTPRFFLSVPKFVAWLNRLERSNDDIEANVLDRHYRPLKEAFVQALLAWGAGSSRFGETFGPVSSYYHGPTESLL
jgi:hypothetical protein